MNGYALHPEMQALLDARGTWPANLTVPQIREAWSVYTKKLWRPAPDYLRSEDMTLQTGAGPVPVRRYRHTSGGTSAAVLYMHGGGFMKGNLDDSDAIAWGLADGTQAQVFNIDYRLAPEHRYPAAFDDCYGVLEYVASNAKALEVNPARIVVCGDSAGGNLAAALCLASRDRKGPAIAAQVQIYPGHGGDPTRGSYIENATAPLLTTAGVVQMMGSYTSGEKYANDPYAQPARTADYAGLPPAYIHTAEIDPIRDDGRDFAARLALAGSQVTFREAKGMLHGFMRARFGGPAAAAEFEAICSYIRGIAS
jgi:acetyl esterase